MMPGPATAEEQPQAVMAEQVEHSEVKLDLGLQQPDVPGPNASHVVDAKNVPSTDTVNLPQPNARQEQQELASGTFMPASEAPSPDLGAIALTTSIAPSQEQVHAAHVGLPSGQFAAEQPVVAIQQAPEGIAADMQGHTNTLPGQDAAGTSPATWSHLPVSHSGLASGHAGLHYSSSLSQHQQVQQLSQQQSVPALDSRPALRRTVYSTPQSLGSHVHLASPSLGIVKHRSKKNSTIVLSPAHLIHVPRTFLQEHYDMNVILRDGLRVQIDAAGTLDPDIVDTTVANYQNKSGYSYHRLLGFKGVCKKYLNWRVIGWQAVDARTVRLCISEPLARPGPGDVGDGCDYVDEDDTMVVGSPDHSSNPFIRNAKPSRARINMPTNLSQVVVGPTSADSGVHVARSDGQMYGNAGMQGMVVEEQHVRIDPATGQHVLSSRSQSEGISVPVRGGSMMNVPTRMMPVPSWTPGPSGQVQGNTFFWTTANTGTDSQATNSDNSGVQHQQQVQVQAHQQPGQDGTVQSIQDWTQSQQQQQQQAGQQQGNTLAFTIVETNAIHPYVTGPQGPQAMEMGDNSVVVQAPMQSIDQANMPMLAVSAMDRDQQGNVRFLTIDSTMAVQNNQAMAQVPQQFTSGNTNNIGGEPQWQQTPQGDVVIQQGLTLVQLPPGGMLNAIKPVLGTAYLASDANGDPVAVINGPQGMPVMLPIVQPNPAVDQSQQQLQQQLQQAQQQLAQQQLQQQQQQQQQQQLQQQQHIPQQRQQQLHHHLQQLRQQQLQQQQLQQLGSIMPQEIQQMQMSGAGPGMIIYTMPSQPGQGGMGNPLVLDSSGGLFNPGSNAMFTVNNMTYNTVQQGAETVVLSAAPQLQQQVMQQQQATYILRSQSGQPWSMGSAGVPGSGPSSGPTTSNTGNMTVLSSGPATHSVDLQQQAPQQLRQPATMPNMSAHQPSQATQQLRPPSTMPNVSTHQPLQQQGVTMMRLSG